MTTLVFQAGQFGALKSELMAAVPNEAAALIICQKMQTERGIRLLANEYVVVPEDAYIVQAPYRLEISPLFLAPIIKRARLAKACLILTHTHPFDAHPTFSPVDDEGERVLIPTFYNRAPDGPHGALVIGEQGFDGRLTDRAGVRTSIDKIYEVGSHLVIRNNDIRNEPEIDPRFDRNVRAFGAAGQRLLESLRVGVVGVGGTGSLIAEQLAHLGVGSLVLLDHDILETSNLNRVVGAIPSDVGSTKVDVAARHVNSINPKADVSAIVGSVLRESGGRSLLDCDFLFCCTDSHGSRAILNQIAYQYLIPMIDMGVRIDAQAGKIKALAGRVQMLAPELSCLACQSLLDPEEVRRDLLTPAQRRADPYIQGHHEPQPAVISVNATVASMAMTMFLSATVGVPSAARHLIYRIAEGTVRSVRPSPDPDCIVCSPRGALAKGAAWEMFWQPE